VLGLLLFAAASAACAVAPNAGLLIAARTVQGLGWHWIFWFNVPIGLVAGVVSLRFLPESFGPRVKLDVAGITLITAAVIGLVWGLTRGNDVGWSSLETLASLGSGALALAGFVVWEARASAPMLPLRFWRVRAFAAGNVTAFLAMGSVSAGAYFAPQYFQLTLGYSPLEAGVRLLPFFLTPTLIAPFAGSFSQRVGLRPVIALGLLFECAGFAWVALAGTLHPSYAELVLALFVAGVGISMTLPTIPTAVLGAVDPEETGMASGVTNMTQRLGAVFGIAVGVAVFSAQGGLAGAAAVTDGFRPAMAVAAAGFALVGAVVAPLIGSRRDKEELWIASNATS
jgi:MFS family permease